MMLPCTGRNLRRALAVLGMLAFAPAVRAADLFVATNGVPASPYNAWSKAYTNLQAALSAAQSNDTIYVAGHVFRLTNQLNWTRSHFMVRGGYAATNDAALPGARDLARWPTVLRANGSFRVLAIAGVTNGRLDGVTITGGGVNGNGGGMNVNAAVNLLVSQCTLTNNAVKSASNLSGAGLYAANSSMTVSNCVVRENRYSQASVFSSGCGGGLALVGGACTVRDSRVVGNSLLSHYTYGAGIYVNGGTHAIRNCLVAHNDCLSYDAAATILGDGVHVDGAGSVVRLENCTVAANSGEGVRRAAGTVTVTNSILWKNVDDLAGVDVAAIGYCNVEDGDRNQTNGCVMADPRWERGYYLSAGSPCVNAGSKTAGAAGLDSFTTRATGNTDTGTVDVGYHYVSGLDARYADLYVATNGVDTNAGTNWTQALRTVTKAARLARDGTRIHVGPGTYVNGSEQFPIVLARLGVQLLGTNAQTTILNAAGSSTRVMELRGSGGDSRIEGITIAGGSGAYSGGGLYARQVLVTVAASTVISNQMAFGGNLGGGIYAEGSFLTISNCTVRKNRNNNWGGGSIAYGGGVFVDGGEALVRDSVVSANKSYGSGGAYGGGLYIGDSYYHCGGHGSHRVVNCLVTENELEVVGANGHGAGIYVGNGSVAVANCTVGNHADEGIKRGAGSVRVGDSILWNNTDDVAGGMALSYCCIQDGDSNGVNGTISLDPGWVGGYRLGDGSPCLDRGSQSVGAAGLGARTVRLDEAPDTGTVDIGYHYAIGAGASGYLDLYVAGTGSDGNPGTNAAAPLRSITKALTLTRDGSRIHVARGLYTNGVETFPLTFSKQGIQLLGTNRASTIVNAAGASRRVITIVNGGAGCRIQGISITKGGGAYAGGGIYAQGTGLTIADCAITNNQMASGGITGGGIHAGLCTLVVSNCLVANNKAEYWGGGSKAYGGGIYAADGNLLVTHSIITTNYALGSGGGYGGGCYLANQTATIRNSLVYRNRSYSNYGAGSHVNGGNVQIVNCTFVSNAGEGIRREAGTASVTNCVVWGNGDDVYGTVLLGYSDVEDGDNNATNGCIMSNPLFENAAAYDYRLKPLSPCRDKGIWKAWMTGARDLLGVARVSGNKPDMGCYECPYRAGTVFMIR